MTTGGTRARAPEAARAMRAAASSLLQRLSPAQLDALCLPWGDDGRTIWNYRPDVAVHGLPLVRHVGLRLVHMTERQQQAAIDLIGALLSARAVDTVRSIMALEWELRELERAAEVPRPLVRDAEQYAWAIYGDPSGDVWAWRVGGHHLSLNVAIIGDHVSPTPMFLGANPARPVDPSIVRAPLLDDEEEGGRAVLTSLDDAQCSAAVFSERPPADILTDAFRHAYPYAVPRGVELGDLHTRGRELLVDLVRSYVGRLTPEAAAAEWRSIEAAGVERITFGWAGDPEPGRPHYYAVQGPTFLLEYDNADPATNHVHTVWRRFDGDWGEDALGVHLARHAEHHRS